MNRGRPSAFPSSTAAVGNASVTSRGEQKFEKPSRWKIWFTAVRPHTLTASICPCLVSFGYCFSTYNGKAQSLLFLYKLFFVWILFCLSVQIGTNLHNDYSDFVQGADKKETRVGHLRATAQGWLTPNETCTAATIALSITFMSGVVLISLTNQWNNVLLWFLVLSSVFNAFAYTGGPYPLGYIGLSKCSIAYVGLADIFVFLYFGLVATYMVPYLLDLVAFGDSVTEDMERTLIAIYGIQVGLLATNIIVVNNLRDRHTDALVGKRTTSVRYGKTFSLVQYTTCNVVTYVLVVVVFVISGFKAVQLLPLLSMIFAYKESTSLFTKTGKDLNEHVGGTAKVQLLFCTLLTSAVLVLH
jgi:1,4-dihydroxy-2-naphthoate octaprenyltransferase